MGSVTTTADSVLHFRYAWDPASPYLGQSPIAFAQTTGQLLGTTEQNLADESKTPGGTLIAVPSTTDSNDLSELASDLQTNKGKILLAFATLVFCEIETALLITVSVNEARFSVRYSLILFSTGSPSYFVIF